MAFKRGEWTEASNECPLARTYDHADDKHKRVLHHSLVKHASVGKVAREDRRLSEGREEKRGRHAGCTFVRMGGVRGYCVSAHAIVSMPMRMLGSVYETYVDLASSEMR